ncbi:SH3 domain-containing protein [Sulfurovum sp. zt1-1]|uniref:SH3 domain-containing protein n=1 Tax=Sulfurovum zhangzhouensis TaxID=3019067 RepID=A0ABT7QXK7_9BACT|nr:SH3 domain-containing C40 family peptidase [Sulfurovum zhangzhouensis]MDM5271565.1 SH3 domain-containing protein [Sulfurovum zhangzhouensis]
MRKLILLSLFVITVIHAEYTLKEGHREKSRIDNMPKNVVADMKRIPQDPGYYAKQIKPFSKHEQKELDKLFNEKYFMPWELTKIDIPEEDFGWEVRFITKKPIYKENGKTIPPSVYNKWIDNANMREIDTKRYKAITIRHTNVKALPTASAFYRDPSKTGEGFPFDYNQNSSYHINVPLYVSHFSRDKRWAFVRGSYAFGWVKVEDIALVGNDFIRAFKNDNYAMTIKDNLRIFKDNNPYSLIKVGALFPISKDQTSYLIASRDHKGHAHIENLRAENPEFIAKKPLAFTPENVTKLAKEFYNEPYGWGGSYECRDCSATTRDFLGVFGIFLRRNSGKQAEDGHRISIQGLEKPFKKRKIIKEAEPFRSLLYVPGHIVLYLGQYKGEPVVMHTYWGIRKKDTTKLITGRTIITSLEPGKERTDVREESKLINTLQNIVTF